MSGRTTFQAEQVVYCDINYWQFEFRKNFLSIVRILSYSDRNRYVFTICCDITKYSIAVSLPTKGSEEVAKTLVNNLSLKYRVPKDHVTEFLSHAFKNTCKLLYVTYLQSVAYHHKAIGSLEASNRQLEYFLRSYVKDDKRTSIKNIRCKHISSFQPRRHHTI